MSYGSQGSRTTLELTREGGHLAQSNGRDPPINIRVTIPGTFPSNNPNVQPATSISGSAAQISLSPPIRLDTNKKWQIVPYNLSVPYTTPNLGLAASNIPGFPNGNSRVSIEFVAVGTYADLVLPAGLYGINDIAAALNQYAQAQGWIQNATLGPLFIVSGINATQQTVITIDPTYLLANADGSGNSAGNFPTGGIILNFTNPSPTTSLNDSMGAMLGFPTTGGGAVLTFNPGVSTDSVSFTSPNRADLARLSAIILYTDIATGSYVDGSSSNAIYTIPVGSSVPNTILSVIPPFEQPVPVGQFLISSFRLWWTDQLGNFLPSFNEDASVSFSIEEVHW